MNELEIESWLSKRFAGAPEPEPPERLLQAMTTDRSAVPVRALPRPRLLAWRPGRRASALVGLAATVVLAAGLLTVVWNRPDTGNSTRVQASNSVTTADGLKLTIESPVASYASGQVIPVTAWLTYTGPNESLAVSAGGSGDWTEHQNLVVFGVKQVGGGSLEITPILLQNLATYTLRRGELIRVPFAKTGASLGTDTAQDRFAEDYLSRPELVLPDGRWEIYAELGYAVEAGPRTAKATIVVTVGAKPSATPTNPMVLRSVRWRDAGLTTPLEGNARIAVTPAGTILVTAFNNGKTPVWSSGNGSNWRQLSEDATNVPGGATVVGLASDGHGGMVAVGGMTPTADTYDAAAWHSTDGGASWRRATMADAAGDQAHGVAAHSGTVVAIGAFRIWRSTDGLTWSSRTLPDSAGFKLEVVGTWEGGFVVVGMKGKGEAVSRVWTSKDGLSWSHGEDIHLSYPRAVASTGGRVVIVGMDQDATPKGTPVSYASTDGLSWTRGEVDMAGAFFTGAATFGGSIVAVSEANSPADPGAASQYLAWASSDGVNWRTLGALPAAGAAHLIAFDGRLVLTMDGAQGLAVYVGDVAVEAVPRPSPAAPASTVPPHPATAVPTATAAPTTQSVRASDAATSDDGLRLTIETPKTDYGAGEAIEIRTTLTYTGPAATLDVKGSGVGLVGFGVRQIGGDGLEVGPAWTADCRPYTLKRGDVQQIAFGKSGGYNETNQTPQDVFTKAYLESRDLVLPAGRWEIYAIASWDEPSCGNSRSMRASVVVDIAAGPNATPASPSPIPVATPTIGPASTPRASDTAKADDGIQLTIVASKTSFGKGERLDVKATLTYTGPAASVTLTHPAWFVEFGAQKTDGSDLHPPANGGIPESSSTTLRRGEPFVVPLTDYPSSLGPGRWVVYAVATYSLDGRDRVLAAAVIVDIA